MTLEVFLDRLMIAESGGRDTAKNPRSTALGPYQFIASTFLSLAHHALGPEIAGFTPSEILALRTNRIFARRAALAYTNENAAYLANQNLKPTFPSLWLAFLVGPNGAARVLKAPADARVVTLLGAAVVRANPFMTNMTAADLIAKAARDISTDANSTAGVKPEGLTVAAPRRPTIKVACNLDKPSCRRWLALAERRQIRGEGRQAVAGRVKRGAK